MASSDKDLGRSRRPGVEDQGWSSIGRVLGGRMIERSGDAVRGLYRAHRDVSFLVEPQKQGQRFPVWTSKPTAPV
jgi:hypothetical protein